MSKSMFEQRHFEALASMMQKLKTQMMNEADWFVVREELGDVLSFYNINFNRERFYWACNPGNNVMARKAYLKDDDNGAQAIRSNVGPAMPYKKCIAHPVVLGFDQLWAETRAAAQKAAEDENAKLGPESSRGFDCGFAWVTMPGTLPFARWAKKQNIASKAYPTGYHIWYSKLHNVPTQSISVHEAAAKAARDYLSHALQTSLISIGSRLD